jgi:styrene-oxide isomerase
MSQLQRVMIANALLVMLVSMFAGFMLMFNLLGGFEIWPGEILVFTVYGTTEGWVRAHSGGVSNALLVMAIAFALPHINVSEFQEKFLAYGFIYVAWSFTVFYWLGNASANRALTFGDNQLGESSLVSVLGFLPGLPSVVLVVVLLVIAVKGILSKKDK